MYTFEPMNVSTASGVEVKAARIAVASSIGENKTRRLKVCSVDREHDVRQTTVE